MNNTSLLMLHGNLKTAAIVATLICLGVSLPSSFGQVHEAPPRPAVAPLIAARYANDADGDRIDDQLLAKAQAACAEERSALSLEQRTRAQAKLAEKLHVELIFNDQITAKQIAAFQALGGEITYIYKSVSYGWNARLPLTKVNAVPAAMGASLLLVNESHPGEAYLDVATRTARVRSIWSPGFAGMPSGLSGSTNVTIAFADTGLDDTHADLVGRGVYWHDYTASNYPGPVDYNNHGTHVSAVALGTGVSSGNSPGPILLTQNGDLTGIGSGLGPDKFPMDLPANAVTVTITAKWNGGGSTSLFLSSRAKGTGGTFGWTTVGSGASGTSPLSLVKTFVTDPGRALTNYTPVLIQNSSLSVADYVLTIQISNAPATDDGFSRLRGVAPGCQWAMAKVLDDAGHSDTFETDLGAAIDDLVALRAVHNIKVLNLSLGLTAGTSIALRQKVNTAVSNGIVVVAAAGNSSTTSTDPARAAMALTVAAMNDINQLTDYSSTGFASPDAAAGEDFKPDLMAPGGSRFGFQSWLISADSNWGDNNFPDQRTNDYRGKWGTSLASPFVAGCAALVIDAL